MNDDALDAEPPATCSTCNYAQPSLSDLADEGPLLLCGRYPPTIVVLDGEPTQVWPTMSETSVCGEHSDFA